MRQAFHEITIATHGRGLVEFTGEVERLIAAGKFRDGLLTLHLRHTSASLLIQENADPDVRRDLDAFLPGSRPMAIRCSSTPPRARTTCPRTSAPRSPR